MNECRFPDKACEYKMHILEQFGCLPNVAQWLSHKKMWLVIGRCNAEMMTPTEAGLRGFKYFREIP